MFDFDKWQEILESIKRHKLRTALTAFGVFWGIFMLVLLLGAGKGLSNGVEFQFSDESINSIWLSPGRTSKPYQGLKEGRLIRFDNDDYEFIGNQYNTVDNVAGRFFLSGDKVVKYKNKALSFSVQCIYPAIKILENIIVTDGRFLRQEDLDERRKVCVIGRIVKEKLFGESEAVGREIIVDNIVYKVVGVFYDSGGEWIMKNIYVPITTAQKIYSGNDRLHRLMFTASGLNIQEMQSLERQVINDFASRKDFHPRDRRALRTTNNASQYKQYSDMMKVINGIIWLVGIFSIIAGVIGVSNIMLIIVKDRTREIGIRKSLGATPFSIVSMILQESIFITGFAGYLGLAAGVGVMALIKDVSTEFWRNPEVNIWIAFISTLILIVAGAIAGLIPALQAAHINPVLAMKSD